MTVFKTAAVLLLSALYLFIVSNNYKLNTYIHEGDQRQYINSAIKIRNEDPLYMGDRNRMPIYPYIMAAFYTPGTTIEDFFQTGKAVNIAISLICVFVVFRVASKKLNSPANWVFTIITAFTLFALKAAYFQVEILFYTLFFITFLLFLDNLKSPSWHKGVVIGLMCALTYLTKATILLGFAFYIGFLMFEMLHGHFGGLRKNSKNILLSAAAILITFIALISPYLIQNKRIFGRYFYNVNTTFYVWYDNIQQAIDGTSARGDAYRWPDMPESEIPSLENYLQNHSAIQIRDRFIVGFLRIILFSIWTYAVIPFSFLLLYSIFLFYFAYINRGEFTRLIKNNRNVLVFTTMFYLLQLTAFSWYASVDSGPRFTLTLFLPTLYLISLALVRLGKGKTLKYFYLGILLVLLLSLKVSIYPITKTVYSGF